MADETNGEVFVRVTNREIWDELKEIRKLVEPLPEDRKRIRSLELKVYTILAGLSSAIAAYGLLLLKAASAAKGGAT